MSQSQITLDGQSWPAHYLSDGDLARYQEFVQATARRLHNPFDGFAEKVAVLPERLQEVALQEFMQSDEYRELPASALIAATGSLEAIALLFHYVTGAMIEVTPANANALWRQLTEYIHQETITVAGDGPTTIAQVNAIRAQAGLPPLPIKTPGPSSPSPPAPAASEAQTTEG